MATTRRAQPATHPTVYVGLALAAVGLLLALYAYTGTRIYDVRFALVAAGGALCAIVGIFVSAWGRAIVASRAQRSRRGLARDDALAAARETSSSPPPTVAAPASKKRFDFKLGARKPRPAKEPASEAPAAAKGAFAFKRRAAPPPPPPPPAGEASVVLAAPEPAHPSAQAPATEAASAEPVLERVTVKCPRCATEFTAEGVRPIPIACPSCGLAGSL